MQRRFGALLALLTASAVAPAQGTLIRVTGNSESELRSAFLAANALAFQTSASQPVVIEFASNLIGATFQLTAALPRLVVDHLTLRVQNAGPSSRVTFDATATTAALRLGCDHAVIRNLGFRSAGRGPRDVSDGIIAAGCHDLTFENCDIDNHTGLGLWLIGSTAVTLRGCNLRQNFGAGFAATDGSESLVVTGCNFAGNGKGVLLSSSDNAQFTQNLLDGNGEGVNVQPGCANVVFGPGNTVRNSTLAPGMTVIGGLLVQIVGNQFTNNQRSGVAMVDLTVQAVVDNNLFQGNGRAAAESQLLLEGAVAVQCRDNTLTGGGAGISVLGCQQVTIAGTTAPAAVSGHNVAGLVIADSSAVRVESLSIRGNLVTVGGAQVSVLDSTGIDLVGTEIAAPPAGGSRAGLDIARSTAVRVGHGSTVLDHALEGAVVRDCVDVLLGQWSSGAGSLAIRGKSPLRVAGSQRVHVVGSAAQPLTIDGAVGTSPLGVNVTASSDVRIGPDVRVDGQQLVTNGIQFADCNGGVVERVTVQGHVAIGVTLQRCAGTLVTGCTVDGAVRSTVATGFGVLVNTGCSAVQLLGNRVTRQQGGGFAVTDSDDTWIGPGNRAVDNAGDGFVIQDTGPTPARRRVTIQSSAAVGRLLAAQSGFRCANMLARFCNVTATRNGGGIVLQRSSNAVVVNSISHGNTNDRNRDPSASGSFYSCLLALATSAGGTWTDVGPIAGNPGFVGAASGDVRLRSTSPAINVGRHATPSGVSLPCVDVDLLPRIRGNVVDVGCSEFVPAGGSGNTLELGGTWLRPQSESVLAFALDLGAARARQPFLLLTTASGTGPGYAAPGGAAAPIVPDLFTAMLEPSALTSGTLDGNGRGAVVLPLPPGVMPLLPPEFTFCAVGLPAVGATNPVVVRFLP